MAEKTSWEYVIFAVSMLIVMVSCSDDTAISGDKFVREYKAAFEKHDNAKMKQLIRRFQQGAPEVVRNLLAADVFWRREVTYQDPNLVAKIAIEFGDGQVVSIFIRPTEIVPMAESIAFNHSIITQARVCMELVKAYKGAISNEEISERETPSDREQVEQSPGQPQSGSLGSGTPQRIMGKDGAEMVLIPAGEFLMGSNDGRDLEKPVHTVYLDAFYMDVYEVTNAQYKKFMDETGHRPPMYWYDLRYNALNQPVVGVTWHDAVAYCRWAGKRLPTEAEWGEVSGYV